MALTPKRLFLSLFMSITLLRLYTFFSRSLLVNIFSLKAFRKTLLEWIPRRVTGFLLEGHNVPPPPPWFLELKKKPDIDWGRVIKHHLRTWAPSPQLVISHSNLWSRDSRHQHPIALLAAFTPSVPESTSTVLGFLQNFYETGKSAGSDGLPAKGSVPNNLPHIWRKWSIPPPRLVSCPLLWNSQQLVPFSRLVTCLLLLNIALFPFFPCWLPSFLKNYRS